MKTETPITESSKPTKRSRVVWAVLDKAGNLVLCDSYTGIPLFRDKEDALEWSEDSDCEVVPAKVTWEVPGV